MVILMVIAVDKSAGRKLLERPMDVTGEYIGYLYSSLVKRGYLKESSLNGYQLTTKGKDALFDFLNENKTRVRDTVRRLHQLGIEIGQDAEREIDQLVSGVVEVR